MGCCIAPNFSSTIEDAIATIIRWTRGSKLLVAGNFNAGLDDPEGTTCVEDIAAARAAAGLEDVRPLPPKT